MYKAFYKEFLLLRYCIYHIPIWDVLDFLPMELTSDVIPLELPLMISEEVVQVV